MVFPVFMYACDSWTIKKAKSWRIYAFELWCWRRLLRVAWTTRRSNQSVLKEIKPEYSFEGLMLKLQYFGHLTWRTDFELWCWRRLLRVPWTARGSNQSILKEINPEYSLKGLMLKLKLHTLATWWEELTHWKTLMLGKIEGRRRRGQEDEMAGWHHWLNGHEFEQALGDSEGQGSLECCSPWSRKESDTVEWLNNKYSPSFKSWICTSETV